jgi:hypothetical protein
VAKRFVYIECGSIITKALVVEADPEVKVVARGEALTTAGFGADDVSVGVQAAVREAEEALGRPLLVSATPLKLRPEAGCGAVFVTSSVAGGALAAVAGVFRDISAESAQRAVLLGGACVSDVFAINDERLPHEKRIDLRQRPLDFLMLAGGVDESAQNKNPGTQAVSVAKLLCGGLPRSRSCPGVRPTVIYAGSTLVRDQIEELFAGVAPVEMTENVRPKIEYENLEPARSAVLGLFQSAISASPRYRNLGLSVAPTGYATTRALEEMGRHTGQNTIIVDIGGAFTSVYSYIGGVMNRTVTDVLGLISNGAGNRVKADSLVKWVPFPYSKEKAASVLGNRRLRPQSVPETWEELMVRLAILREEARLGLEHHKELAVTLRGIQRKRQIWEIFGNYESVGGQTLVDLSKFDNVIIAGGWLRGRTTAQIAAVAMEGLQTAGINKIFADSEGVLALSGRLLEAAEITPGDILPSLVSLGTCVSPMLAKGGGGVGFGSSVATAVIENPFVHKTLTLQAGKITRQPFAAGEKATLTINPRQGMDFGQGAGKKVQAQVTGGPLGVIFDTRTRPLVLPSSDDRRRARLLEWWEALGVFPAERARLWEGGAEL